MGTKTAPGKFDCYGNALPDEPMFILLARDPSAPLIIDAWALRRQDAIARGERPVSDKALVAEAFKCAEEMRSWRRLNDGVWRVTPPEPVQ